MLGTTIAYYKITAKLGQGGMGEVYRATDTKLDREVAIKVLPQSVALDKERLARFEREAKVLAQLNHPNIAGVYGLEQSGETQALVLELVEGDDLSVRLKRGPLLVDEALEVCKQIAEALEAAHEKGIIHRDLKPGNIKLTKNGKVKVLDFGLAKALSDEFVLTSSSDQEDSPTITDAFTKPGTILGTAAYMSPEQARGKHVDKRTDIWAFGCVLFECLTGKKAFQGDDVTETLAGIIKGEPDWTLLPRETSLVVQLLLRKCLAKDRRKRQRNIDDALVDLEQAQHHPDTELSQINAHFQDANGKGRKISIGWAFVLMSLVAAVSVAVTWNLSPFREPSSSQPRPVRHFSVDLELESGLNLSRGSAIKLSPDGRFLGQVVGNRRQLILRRLDALDTSPRLLVENVDEFCFSPDGGSIVFTSDALRVVPVAGGASRIIAERVNPKFRNLDWASNGDIVMDAAKGGLYRMNIHRPNEKMEVLIPVGNGEKMQRTPQILPDDHGILFTEYQTDGESEDGAIMVWREGKQELLQVDVRGSHARYVSARGRGYMVVINQGAMYAMPFDLSACRPVGPQVQVLPEVYQHSNNGVVQYDISTDGLLVYVRGTARSSSYEYAFLNEHGSSERLELPEGNYGFFDLSPDEKYLAYQIETDNQWDIWICYMEQGFRSARLTLNAADDLRPKWSPESRHIVFISNREEQRGLYVMSRDGDAHLLHQSDANMVTWDWHPEGSDLVVGKANPSGGMDLKILHLETDPVSGWNGKALHDFKGIPSGVRSACFSPDGKWLAYCSGGLGGAQVFVQRFPEGGGKFPVTNQGFVLYPHFNDVDSSLMYVQRGENGWNLMKTQWNVKDEAFNVSDPVPWNREPLNDQIFFFRGVELTSDGQRVLLMRNFELGLGEQAFDHVMIYENFFETLRQKILLAK